jgi:ABC transporter substrate binding protein (PQQ-dependent alcohol dehydrogenase system)
MLALLSAGVGRAQDTGTAPSRTANIVHVSREAVEDPRASLSEPVAPDYGWLGAKFGASELNVQGRFLGAHFELTEVKLAPNEDLAPRIRGVLDAHPALVVSDLEAGDLLALADLKEMRGSVIVDARTSDDSLRHGQCRGNVFHVLPSWEMRAYALSRFLAAKDWRNWLLLSGATEDDRAYSEALRQAARGVRARIVGQSPLPASGPGESPTQAQIDARLEELTRTAAPYDLVLVTDARGGIGERILFNTAAPRLVAGTQGLRATAWDPQFRDFAARGFGFRFAQFASRDMGERDYGNWLAVTVIGEAVLRGGATQPAAVESYLLSSRFSVAAMKGEPLTFRRDTRQLRQPILLFGPKVLVALVPSEAPPDADAGLKTRAFAEERPAPCDRPDSGPN